MATTTTITATTAAMNYARLDSANRNIGAPFVWAATGALDMFLFSEEDGEVYDIGVFRAAYENRRAEVIMYLIENNHPHASHNIDKKVISCLTIAGCFPGNVCLVHECTDISENEGLCTHHTTAVTAVLNIFGLCSDVNAIIVNMVKSQA